MAGPAPDNGSHAGLFDSLKGLAATGIAIVQTRLELLSTEVAEEKERLLSLLLTGVAALFFIGLGVIFLALLLTVVFWQSHRLLVLGLLAGSFFTLGFVALAAALRFARRDSRLFTDSIGELAKDREHLKSRP